MKAFVKPESHFVRHTGGLCSKDLAELSDAELAAYLEKSGFAEEKKKYRIREGYVLRQIAGALGMSEGSVNTRLTRGRQRLRRQLEEKGVRIHEEL